MKKIIWIPRDQLALCSARTDETSFLAGKQFERDRNNMSIQGIQTPLIIYRDPNSDKFFIADGNRRFRIGIDIGYKEFPCIIIPTDSIPEIQFGANSMREPLRRTQVAEYIQELVHRTKKSDPEIQKITGLTTRVYQKLKTLRHIIPSLRSLVDKKTISIDAAYVIGKLNSKGQKQLHHLFKDLDLVKTKVTYDMLYDLIKTWPKELFRGGRAIELKPSTGSHNRRKAVRLKLEKTVDDQDNELKQITEKHSTCLLRRDRLINFFRIMFRQDELKKFLKKTHSKDFENVMDVLKVNNAI